jgi:hypothetical protein
MFPLCPPYAGPMLALSLRHLQPVIRHLSSQRASIHKAADATEAVQQKTSETKAAGNEKARELKRDRSVVELFAAEREVVRREGRPAEAHRPVAGLSLSADPPVCADVRQRR